MSSSDYEDLLSAYFDNELSDEDRARAEQLLAEDESAQQFVEELGALRADLQTIPVDRLPDSFANSIIDRVQSGAPHDTEVDDGVRIAPPRFSRTSSPNDGRFSWRDRAWRPLAWVSLATAAALCVAFFSREERPIAFAPQAIPKSSPRPTQEFESAAAKYPAAGSRSAGSIAAESTMAESTPAGSTAESLAEEFTPKQFSNSPSPAIPQLTSPDTSSFGLARPDEENLPPQIIGRSLPLADESDILIVEAHSEPGVNAPDYLQGLFDQNHLAVIRQQSNEDSSQDAAQKPDAPAPADQERRYLVTGTRQQLDAVIEELHLTTSPVRNLSVRAAPSSALDRYALSEEPTPGLATLRDQAVAGAPVVEQGTEMLGRLKSSASDRGWYALRKEDALKRQLAEQKQMVPVDQNGAAPSPTIWDIKPAPPPTLRAIIILHETR